MKTVSRKMIVPGGSGFLGQMLSNWFSQRGWDVVVLARKAGVHASARVVAWDGKTIGSWANELEGVDAVVNLAGRSVDCRYNAKNRREIMDSRVLSTRVLGEAIAGCKHPPRVWLNSSTATIYKHSLDQPMDEQGKIAATREAKDKFSVEVACAWEKAFQEAATPHTRKVALRTAMVFGAEGSVFHVLRRLTRIGLGGKMGSGRQYVSWIHEEDFCRAIEWLIEQKDFSGVVNLASPNPLPNAEMMRSFRSAFGMSIGLPAASWMLEAGAFFLRTETELIIKSRRVVPGRLLGSGFSFQYPQFRAALENLIHRSATASRIPAST